MNTKTVYNYNPDTGEYLGPETAYESPMEPGVYLIPAHATTIAPPEADAGHVAVFADGAWTLVEDHRGEVWYDTATQERHDIKALDEAISNTWTQSEPTNREAVWNGEAWEVPFDVLKERKRREIWGAGDAVLASVKARYTQAEIESWSKQEQGAKDLAAGETTTEAAQFVAGIATLRGIPVDTLRDKILANVTAYGQLCTAVIGTQQRLDDLIKAAQTADDLAAITWPEDLGGKE